MCESSLMIYLSFEKHVVVNDMERLEVWVEKEILCRLVNVHMHAHVIL
jgi:hypothetical protein